MKTANLSWFFFHEYYDDLIPEYICNNSQPDEKVVSQKNQELRNAAPAILNLLELPGELRVDLLTEYPGLLAGTGYRHAAGIEGEIGLGFSLDYVTGLPYLPGSSVKGILRAAFQHKEYIRELLNEICRNIGINTIDIDHIDIAALVGAIFGDSDKKMGERVSGADIFLDAFPLRGENGKLMELDAITPHPAGGLEAPTPLTLLKVRPGVVFRFRFLLHDSGAITAEIKKKLFTQILVDLGAGAKTNVGFGRFCELVPDEKVEPIQTAPPGVCQKCGKPTGRNSRTGEYYPFCFGCSNYHTKKG